MTKMGTENPSTANTIVARSTRVPARHAANTPRGTAMRMLRMVVRTERATSRLETLANEMRHRQVGKDGYPEIALGKLDRPI